MHNMSETCSNINVVRQQLVLVGESRLCTLIVRGPRHTSLSGVLYGCARFPINTSGSSMDGNQPLLLLSSSSHAFGQLHALLPLTELCFLMLMPSCAPCVNGERMLEFDTILLCMHFVSCTPAGFDYSSHWMAKRLRVKLL